MTFIPSGSNRRVNRAWQMPRNHAEMVQRRKALVTWAEQHHGFMGRSPDHLAFALQGQVMGIEVFKHIFNTDIDKEILFYGINIFLLYIIYYVS